MIVVVSEEMAGQSVAVALSQVVIIVVKDAVAEFVKLTEFDV